MMLSWDNALHLGDVCLSAVILTMAARPRKSDVTQRNSGCLLTPKMQNLDVLSTFCGCKYGRLDVIQNCAFSLTIMSRMFVCEEAVLMSHTSAKQATIDSHITSFLKHAPEKPGCNKYKVRYLLPFISLKYSNVT